MSVIANPEEENASHQHFHQVGSTNVFVPQLFHDTKSIFYHQVQFFYFVYYLK